MTDPMTRIAEALERLAPPTPGSPPPPVSADPYGHRAYLWQGAALVAARDFRPLGLDRLHGIDRQRDALRTNLERLAGGHAAHDALLWGARGTGKSALVKAVIGALQDAEKPIALVEIVAPLTTLPALFSALGPVDRAFAIFIDDLGFEAPGEGRALRSMLEGGADARPDNARLIVTANRRHLMPRDLAEQESAINPRDSIDDNLALADRFGLSLGFHAVDQDGYLKIVRDYADAHGLPFDADDAIGWATRRGSRSGRVAWQYVVDLAGRCGKSL